MVLFRTVARSAEAVSRCLGFVFRTVFRTVAGSDNCPDLEWQGCRNPWSHEIEFRGTSVAPKLETQN